jgi:hypothetical protein
MKKLKSIMFTLLAIVLLSGVLCNHCLAQSYNCYLPFVSYDPTPPAPVITPVTPEFVVGSWVMTNASNTIDFFLHIQADNTLSINDYPNNNEHLIGTWSISGGTFIGPFINLNLEGNNTGDLVGTIVNGVFLLDFIEYWHDPPKHVPYTATRI